MNPCDNSLITALNLRRQKGVVLLFTLIALVAMTMAALAMMRSVDTSNMIAGNIALKQGAIQETERVINSAFNCLDRGGPLTLAVGMLDANVLGPQPCHQYFASLQADTKAPFGFPDLLKGDPSSIPSSIVRTTDAGTGNTSVYIIERMCRTAGIWEEGNCIEIPGTPATDGDVRTQQSLSVGQAAYRISVRVYGPRNLNAYSQMVMGGGM